MTESQLSGRLDSVERNISFFQQDLLLKPDTTAYSALLSTWNQQYTIVYNKLSELEIKLRTLQSLYSNIYTTVGQNLALFTGHTGHFSYGANPVHSGAS